MLTIAQNQDYKGSDWWDWSAWIEGDKQELDGIEEVVWHLHPSFTPPVVKCADRSKNFRLDTSGWGTFKLVAKLKLKDGSAQSLARDLELFYPDDEQRPMNAAVRRK